MGKSSPISHILVLVDGTDSSFHAADCAIDLASALEAKLTALAVVDRDTLRQLLSVKIVADAEMDEFEKELKASAQQHLASVHERAKDRRLTIEEVLVVGNVEEIVPRTVEERKVELIVVGGFHSSRVTRDLLARQRQQIVDGAACPVLVVK
jgi:nucleotide-binding universal stress UspA family protein